MTEKKGKKDFTLSDEELGSKEMVFITLSMLESRGYPGLLDLFSIINDPEVILKIIRFLYGTTLKIPPLKEFTKTLRAATYAYCDMHKKIHINLAAKPLDIREHMNITKEEEKELLDIFDDWVRYMQAQGKDVLDYMHCNRSNTKKRIRMTQRGKKWTSSKY